MRITPSNKQQILAKWESCRRAIAQSNEKLLVLLVWQIYSYALWEVTGNGERGTGKCKNANKTQFKP